MWRDLWGEKILLENQPLTVGQRGEKGLWIKSCSLQVTFWGGVQHLPELAKQPSGFYIIIFLNVF